MMTTTERMIRDLEATKKSFEGKFVGTGEVNVVWMIEDIVSFIKAQEVDAELGRAVMLAIKENHNFLTYEAFDCFGFAMKDIQDLIEWAKGRTSDERRTQSKLL